MENVTPSSLLVRHEFLLRRLHSLSGLVPVGAYMCVHLLTNTLTTWGVEPFQNAVYQIHALGPALLFVEWGFIFLPLLFHGGYGFVIAFSGRSNVGHYGYGANWRYTLQRITGMIAAVFIVLHVLHLHGWFHIEPWRKAVLEPLGMGVFAPYNATSTLAAAFQRSVLVPALYAVGVFSCVYHLANGIWTMGITWGAWVTPKAQSRAGFACLGLGGVLSLIGLAALIGPLTVDPVEAEIIENRMYDERTRDGSVIPNPEKRSHADQGEAKVAAQP